MIEQFFNTAVERERIRLARESSKPWPWTTDDVFQQYRFCNVHRENDRTTRWFRDNIREPLRNKPLRVIEATFGFRMFNLIETGERLKPILLKGWNESLVKKAMEGAPQVVTGAYMVHTPAGMNKVDGICAMMRAINGSEAFRRLGKGKLSLQEAHALIEDIRWQGHFTAYEVVTDLRHTCVLENAPDIMTWANPGPGAQRGLGWVYGRKFSRSKSGLDDMNRCMRELLGLSETMGIWPELWEPWEMREVEHWLCEFDKYQRALRGGHMKRRFKCPS